MDKFVTEFLMYAKLIVLTVLLVGLAAGLFSLRHQHAQVCGELIAQRRTAQRLQTDLWQAQALAANVLTPQYVRQQITRAQLALEPATPQLAGTNHVDFARSDAVDPITTQ